MSKGCTQCSSVLSHIQKNGSISSLEAIQLYGITRLAARILDLKDMGFHIESTLEKSNGKRYSRYFFKKEDCSCTA